MTPSTSTRTETTTRPQVRLPAPRTEPALLPDEPYTARRFLRELGIAVGILAVGLPVVLVATSGTDPQPAPVAAPLVAPAAEPEALPRAASDRPVLVLSGSGLAGQGLVDRLGQGGTAVSEPGAGWASGLPSLTSLIAERDWDAEQDMVVLQGGEADVALPPERVELAALQLADRLRAKFSPSTDLVFVGPVPSEGVTAAQLEPVRAALASAAAQKSIHWVDPVAQGWTSVEPEVLVGAVEVYLAD